MTRTVPTLTLGTSYLVYWVASSSVGEVFLSVEKEGVIHPLARIASSTAGFLGMTSELKPLPAGEYYGAYDWDAGASGDGTALGEGEGYKFFLSHQGFGRENTEDSSDVFSLVE